MNPIEILASQPVAYSVGWALLHFLWQGVLLAGLYAVVAALLRDASANARYLAGIATLAAMVAAPVITLGIVHGAQPWWVPAAALNASITHAPMLAADGTEAARMWLPWVTVAWLLGVLVLGTRITTAWMRVQALCRVGVTAAPEWLAARAARLARELRVPVAVTVLQSTRVHGPMVIGWLRPVLLLPVGALTGLTYRQLEMILTHELAHVRRFDYLVNLLQAMVETLLFYHPAVRWVSAQIRIERENCCDDIVIAHAGDPVAYARALAVVAEQAPAPARPGLALAATGGTLLDRIQRLCGLRPRQHGRVHPGWLLGLAAVIALAAVLAATRPWVDTAPAVDDTASVEVPDDPAPAMPEPDEPTEDGVVPDDEWIGTAPALEMDALPTPSPDGLLQDMQDAAESMPTVRGELATSDIARAPRIPALSPPALPAPRVDDAEDEADEQDAGDDDRAQAPEPTGNGLRVALVAPPELPESLSTPSPEYPRAATRRGLQGQVRVAFTVTPSGRVDDIQVVHSDGGEIFDREVLRALGEWRFAPPSDGLPVGATQTFTFRQQDSESTAHCTVTGSRLCNPRRHRQSQVIRQNVMVIGRSG